MRRREPPPSLTARQKVAIFNDTAMAASEAVDLSDDAFTFELIMRHGVRAPALLAADFGPLRLLDAGVEECSSLRRLGFSALHLCSEDFAREVAAAFGADAVVDTFLVSSEDAVVLAGEEACRTLGVTLERLLGLCAGAPSEAFAVLQQTYAPDALEAVRTRTLLDTGLRGPQLKRTGYQLAAASKSQGTSDELAKLGYGV